jgi:hypothetical protein
MSSMANFMKQMQLVNEPGLASEQTLRESKEAKKLSGSKSIGNFIDAYKQMQGVPTSSPVQLKENINDSDKLKLLGALQVMKEVLSEDFVKHPKQTMEQLVSIIKSV